MGNLVRRTNKEELRQMTKRQENWWLCTRPYIQEMTDRLYVSRKEWERGPACIEDCVEASIQRHMEYNEKRKEMKIEMEK